MTEIRVPTLGESVTEATIGRWFKKAGDAVAVDEPLVELETDKVTIEVPAPSAGVLGEIAAKDGETVAVGALLGQINEGAAGARPAAAPANQPAAAVQVRAPSPADDAAREERVKMTRLRQTIARRLKDVQNTAAMLTTFNEVDMTNVMALRAHYKDAFEKKHGSKLGFMGFFTKAVVQALKDIPAVNAEIDGTDLIYKNYYKSASPAATTKALVVPVVRDCDQKSIA